MSFQEKVKGHFKSYETSEITSEVKGGLWRSKKKYSHILWDKTKLYLNLLPEFREEIKNLMLEKQIKSIKYLESDKYRRMLSFIESDTYQIYIMGHSCGNSDRTLLNTLFEHKNCVSIKPFYFNLNSADSLLA